MTAKEQQLADTLACPNCGSREFTELNDNAALTFECDCGLKFNFMPQLRHVQIVHDPVAIVLGTGMARRILDFLRRQP